MRAPARLLPIAIVVLVGCGAEPSRSRVVPATESGAASTPDARDATTKDPRRIATH